MRGWRMFVALALLAPGCATAEGLGGQEDAGTPPPDVDAAAQPDAPEQQGPTAVTLSQTTNDNILDGNSFSCSDSSGIHADNSYYRVFDLAAEGINSDLEVDTVSVAIQFADAGGDASQPIEVKLHTLDGSFVVANLTQLASTQVSVPDQTLSMLDVPLAATVPGGSKLVVEVFSPDGAPNHAFRPGSNKSGESAPGFIRAPSCGNDEPIDISTVIVNNQPSTMDLILEVSGMY